MTGTSKAMAQIRALPIDVAAQIRASADISSLNDVVCSLLANALDAAATNITIRIDYTRGSCWIEDNGHGISRADFEETGGLGKPHHTSNSARSLSRLGTHGLFLASVAAVSVMSITSRYRDSHDANTLILHHAEPAVRLIPSPEHLLSGFDGHGTKVVVNDLFGNMPVRVKQRPYSHEDRPTRNRVWKTLCFRIMGMLLACRKHIHLRMVGTDTDHTFKVGSRLNETQAAPRTSTRRIDSENIKSLLRQGLGIDVSAPWVATSARTKNITVRALISLEPAANRDTQFICLGVRHISAGEVFGSLYDAINRVFTDSSFGLVEDSPRKRAGDLGPMVKQLRGTRKGLERWPMFVIHIENNQEQEIHTTYRNDFIKIILDTIVTMTSNFLAEQNFRPRKTARIKSTQYEKESAHSVLGEIARKTRDTRLSSKIGLQDNVVDLAGCRLDFRLPEYKKVNIASKDDTLIRSRFISSKDVRTNSSRTTHRPPLVDSTPNITRRQTKDGSSPTVAENASKILPILIDNAHEPPMDQIAVEKDIYEDWIDPKTRKPYRINTRTGCLVADHSFQRPVTAQDSNLQLAASRKGSDSLPRLVRSSHGIGVPSHGSWVEKFFETWSNPVFEAVEDPIKTIQVDAPHNRHESTCHHALYRAGNPSQETLNDSGLKLSRSALDQAIVISQVDSKFILLKTTEIRGDTIVLVDQHASDERIKVEKLMQDLCSPPQFEIKDYTSPLGHRSMVNTNILEQPIFFELQFQEHRLFKEAAARFAEWGILYDLVLSNQDANTGHSSRICRLVVLSLPPSIVQRCKVEPSALINLLRSEVHKLDAAESSASSRSAAGETRDWTKQVHSCPQGILDLINSRACRSAIMFNDTLSRDQCQTLVSDLAKCTLPFQCAHGRPSMVPLLDLSSGEQEALSIEVDADHAFHNALQSWLGAD